MCACALCSPLPASLHDEGEKVALGFCAPEPWDSSQGAPLLSGELGPPPHLSFEGAPPVTHQPLSGEDVQRSAGGPGDPCHHSRRLWECMRTPLLPPLSHTLPTSGSGRGRELAATESSIPHQHRSGTGCCHGNHSSTGERAAHHGQEAFFSPLPFPGHPPSL